MPKEATVPRHIETTELMVRLYVFLSQYLDRCLNEAARQSYPELDLQRHLAETRATLSEILSVNRVVRNKVDQECDRILALGATCMKGSGNQAATLESVKAERAILQNKTIALSDLLAVFRSV